jgi:hypothetical protein
LSRGVSRSEQDLSTIEGRCGFVATEQISPSFFLARESYVKQIAKVEAAVFVFRLDSHSGVPVYRRLIDQVQAAMGALAVVDQFQLCDK